MNISMLKKDIAKVDGVIDVEIDTDYLNELRQISVLAKFNVGDSGWWEKRKSIPRLITEVCRRHGFRLADPPEDQGTWWYIVFSMV